MKITQDQLKLFEKNILKQKNDILKIGKRLDKNWSPFPTITLGLIIIEFFSSWVTSSSVFEIISLRKVDRFSVPKPEKNINFLIVDSFNFRIINYVKIGINEIVYRSSFIVSAPEKLLKDSYLTIQNHNKLYKEKIGWEVNQSLISGMKNTFEWIDMQVNN